MKLKLCPLFGLGFFKTSTKRTANYCLLGETFHYNFLVGCVIITINKEKY